MRQCVPALSLAFTFAATSMLLHAQTAAPRPERIAAAQLMYVAASEPAPMAAAQSTQTAAAGKPVPEGRGRAEVIAYLDAIAARNLETRRAVVAGVTTREAAVKRQALVRKQLLELIGPLPERTPLEAKVLGTTAGEGFRVEKILFDSQPGFHVTALLYLPEGERDVPVGGKEKKLPAILIAPGHGATGKAGDYGFAVAFARRGFAVLSYDPMGQGERLLYPDPAHAGQSLAGRPTGEHGEAGLQPVLLGETITKYFLWDAMRGIDYLASRPEVDADRIGAFGCSGGGLMTALVAALDTRVAAAGTACFITSFDTLLPSLGPQDGEQSIPNFLVAGESGAALDFPDWVELAAPRPYAVISTTADMFPFAGAQSSEAEARRFYGLFGFGAEKDLSFITGPGGHGNIRPLTGQIVEFFATHLKAGAAGAGMPAAGLVAALPPAALQVTPTGQVAMSYPGSATVQTLNARRAAELRARGSRDRSKPLSLDATRKMVREVTHAVAIPGAPSPRSSAVGKGDPEHIRHRLRITTEPGITIDAEFYRPTSEGRHPTLLIVRESLDASLEGQRGEDIARLRAMAKAGTAVFVMAPRPSPPGTEDFKAPVLGPYYLLGLRAELVGKTLLGMRVDDVIRAIDFFSTGSTEDPNNITAEASGHLGLVLLHAAVLDARLKHITVDHALASYDSLVKATMPVNAPEDILPGVYLRYDTGDLLRGLGERVTFTEPIPGSEDLAGASMKK